jgi:hypothetical protein
MSDRVGGDVGAEAGTAIAGGGAGWGWGGRARAPSQLQVAPGG